MHMVIATVFLLIITSILAYGAYYECEHFDENHRKKRKRAMKPKRRMKAKH